MVSYSEAQALALITVLHEGGNEKEMIKRAAALKAAGVNIVVLLALSDDGTSGFDRRVAEQLAALAISSFACTPTNVSGADSPSHSGAAAGSIIPEHTAQKVTSTHTGES